MDKKLIDYYPIFLQKYRELIEITDTEQIEFEKLWDALDKVLKNQYIKTLNNEGASRWERILKINPKDTDSIEDRRFRILTRFNVNLPYTTHRLREMFNVLCGANGYKIDLKEYTLTVKVELVAKSNFDDVDKMLKKIIPANLKLNVELIYNQHRTLKKYTHKQLHAYTHNKIRNEVING